MESKPLTYQSLKSILKHLVFNLRFKLSQQSLSTRTALKIQPGYVNCLEFRGTSVRINRTTYKLKITKAKREGTFSKVELSVNGDLVEKAAAVQDASQALGYLVQKVLAAPEVLKVGTLIFNLAEPFKLSETLKLHVHHLKVFKEDASEALQQFDGIFQNSTFKTLEVDRIYNYKDPLILSAETLILSDQISMRLIPNQRVHARFHIIGRDLIDLIDRWLGKKVRIRRKRTVNTEKEAGARYTFEMKGEKEARDSIDEVKRKYEMEYYVEPRWLSYTPSFVFPMRNFSELRLNYAVEDEKWILDMQVVQSF